MKLVKQNSPTTCGQACVAMVLGITLEESIGMFGHSNTTSDFEILKALGQFYIQTIDGTYNTDWVGIGMCPFISGEPSKVRIAICRHEEPNGNRAHWTVWDHGEILDPACIKGKLWPIVKYIEINHI